MKGPPGFYMELLHGPIRILALNGDQSKAKETQTIRNIQGLNAHPDDYPIPKGISDHPLFLGYPRMLVGPGQNRFLLAPGNFKSDQKPGETDFSNKERRHLNDAPFECLKWKKVGFAQ